MNHVCNIGLDDLGNMFCLVCKRHFTKKALKIALEIQHGDSWQTEYQKLKSAKMSMRAKMRKVRFYL